MIPVNALAIAVSALRFYRLEHGLHAEHPGYG